jgi:hypothetical protein
MTRINAIRTIAETRSLAWGKPVTTWGKNTGALIFAAVLIVCSVTVGCSSDKPKPVSSSNPTPVTPSQPRLSPMPVPAVEVAAKAAPRKVVHKAPATVNYTDQTYDLTFEYPRRYAIETGSAATDLLASSAIPMNFVQPGGVALAAVELPETGFTNTDFSSAFFNVSVNQSLTADQCTEFTVPRPKVSESQPQTCHPEEGACGTKDPLPAVASAGSDGSSHGSASASTAASSTTSTDASSNSKLMLGDLELRATEAVSGEGTRQSDSKYFHVFQNGACYEFALNVTTDASEGRLVKHVDRDKVFNRLEKMLATVKINPVSAPEVAAEAPAPPPAATPAQ